MRYVYHFIAIGFHRVKPVIPKDSKEHGAKKPWCPRAEGNQAQQSLEAQFGNLFAGTRAHG